MTDNELEQLREDMVRQHGPEIVALRKLAYWGVDDDVHPDEVPLLKAVDQTLEKLDALEAQVEEQQQVIHRVEEIKSDVGNKTATIAQIVAYADRVRDGNQVVTVRPKEMTGAADISKRYARVVQRTIGRC